MSNSYPYQITMLQAEDGDCFFLEFGEGRDSFTMLIDCGRSTTWEKLKCFLDEETKNWHEKKKIDVLLITHFDQDHIEGALELFRDDVYSQKVGEVWHNGLPQIAPYLPQNVDEISDRSKNAIRAINDAYRFRSKVGSGPVSGGQSMELSLHVKKHGIQGNPWGETTAITNETQQVTKRDVVIDFLLPTKKRTDALITVFRKEMRKKIGGAEPVLTDEAIMAFAKLMLYSEPVERIEGSVSAKKMNMEKFRQLAMATCDESDNSATNGSSISIIIQYHGKKFLFPGDAWGKDLSDAVTAWQENQKKLENQQDPEKQKKQENENLEFEVVKLPHHGSKRNCIDFLTQCNFSSRYYLVSTNGKHHGHPDPETLAKLIFVKPGKKEICFNYENIYRDFAFLETENLEDCTLRYKKDERYGQIISGNAGE